MEVKRKEENSDLDGGVSVFHGIHYMKESLRSVFKNYMLFPRKVNIFTHTLYSYIYIYMCVYIYIYTSSL